MLSRCRARSAPLKLARSLHASTSRKRELFDPSNVDRPSDEVDVCIVGAGPAGLSAAIRLKQLEQEKGREIRVVVLEKGAEVGSHILSGAVIEPRALNELLPDWKERPDHPLSQPTTSTQMRLFTKNRSFRIPQPPQMAKMGTYVVSLSRVTAWLGSIAEEMGVEVYPGFAGAGLVYSADGKAILGVRTNEVGLDRQGRMKDAFEPGMEFRSRVTLLAEGAHGSLSKEAIRRFKLREGRDPQTYGLGIKEVWRVDPSKHEPGKVVHSMGWPLDLHTYGGGWAYHMADGLVTLGLVVGLDYPNPYLSPYRELQRMKHHPYFRDLLSGESTRIAYGARVLNEGGLQSVPKLNFPGGALIGCSAGFVNVAKIKGTHNAMKSGMLAAEAAFDVVASDATSEDEPADMSAYETSLHKSWVHDDLYEVRNVRPSFNTSLGILGGVVYSGIDTLLLRGRTPWTFRNKLQLSDAAHTKRASECKPIEYPPFQPPLSTDLLTSVALTGTNHAEDQPVHLRVRRYLPQSGGEDAGVEGSEPEKGLATERWTEDASVRRAHVHANVEEYAGLLGRGCPAQVYEYVDADGAEAETTEVAEQAGWGGKRLVINSQNCIHCKFCDVKVPTQDITWTVPEGGGGPKYTVT
ncbi:FAD/NAD-P-binding domain-containing protein [Trametes versicolor FP-101664 SS1]|uniref:FAD/NAD-P-binding domain-containing protein n=1 Tax=Trametes versicolor (strain FP-101664) TaxID=717944 RepID=UPI00046217C2|nr:FAD/NAD-P-binding domain-containing protein [Trametes versicolor FP-101664 SS1]EIW61123.1 FAD/NAD-P-binding domain-containing protein [Trametes versicolor FP-101664 SS1]